ncbi:MAG: DUF2231 domain-containing protein [Acidimicrobiia bacterium]
MNMLFAMTIGGVPAHPLLVHIPVVLIPLVAVAAIGAAIFPSWRERYGSAIVAVAFVGMVGAVLAASAGEDLREKAKYDHAEKGDLAKAMSIVMFLVLAAWLYLPIVIKWWNARKGSHISLPKWLPSVLMIASVLVSVGSAYAVYDAGHSGAKSKWGSGEGGPEYGDDDEDEDGLGAPVVVNVR